MILTKDAVIKAIEGVLLIENPVLWEDNESPTQEHYKAIKLINENQEGFRQFVADEIKLYPNIHHFFGTLIGLRLSQDKPLASPTIQSLFHVGSIELENRLQKIAHIPNIETISNNARPPKSFDQGIETDEVIRDIWAEFFVADLLVSTIKVDYVEKTSRGNSKTTVDFIIGVNNEIWIVEVARLRKRDFHGETMPWGSKDCTKQENIDDIQMALGKKLSDKNEQVRKFVSAENSVFDKRIIAIKTSQEEYQDCSQIIAEETRKLMKNNSFTEITHAMLIYDIKTYDLIENKQTK